MGVDLYTWYHQVKKKDLGETKENWLQHLQEQALSKKRTKKEQKSYDGSPGMPAGDFFESGLREGASGIASTKNSKCSTPRTPEKLIKSPFSALLDSSFITPTLVLSHSKDDGSPETSCVSPPFNPNALGLDLFSPVISKANTSVKVAASLGANLDDSLSSWTSALATPLTTDARAQTPTTLERLTLHPKQGLRQKVMVRSLFSPRTPGTSTRTDESPNLGIIKCYSPIPTFNNRAVLKQQKQMPDNSSLPLLSDTQSFRVCDKGNSSEEGKQLQLNVNQLEGSGLSLNNINPDIDGGPEQTAKGPGQILHHGTDVSLPSSPEESLGCHKLGSSLKPDDGTQFCKNPSMISVSPPSLEVRKVRESGQNLQRNHVGTSNSAEGSIIQDRSEACSKGSQSKSPFDLICSPVKGKRTGEKLEHDGRKLENQTVDQESLGNKRFEENSYAEQMSYECRVYEKETLSVTCETAMPEENVCDQSTPEVKTSPTKVEPPKTLSVPLFKKENRVVKEINKKDEKPVGEGYTSTPDSKAVLKKLSVHKNKRLSGRFLYPRKAEAGYEKLNMKYQECLDDAQTTVIDADMADITTENVSQESKSEKTPKDIHDIANRQQNFVSLATLEKDDRLGLEKTLNSNETKYRAQLEMGRQEEPMKQASEKTKIFVGKFSGETDRNAISPTREEGRATHSMNVNIMSKDGRSEATWTEPEDLQTAIGLQVVPQKDLKSKQEVIEHAGGTVTVEAQRFELPLSQSLKSEASEVMDDSFNDIDFAEIDWNFCVPNANTETNHRSGKDMADNHALKGDNEDAGKGTKGFCGFSTGLGKSVKVSDKALQHAKKLLEDTIEDEYVKDKGSNKEDIQNNPSHVSKNTVDKTSHKHEKKSISNNFERSEYLFHHEADQLACLEKVSKESTSSAKLVQDTNIGFKTARGTSIVVNPEVLNKVKRLWAEEMKLEDQEGKTINVLDNTEFGFKDNKTICDSTVQLQKNLQIANTSSGFATAAGKAVTVSEKALKKAFGLLEESSEEAKLHYFGINDSFDRTRQVLREEKDGKTIQIKNEVRDITNSENYKESKTSSSSSVLKTHKHLDKNEELTEEFADVDGNCNDDKLSFAQTKGSAKSKYCEHPQQFAGFSTARGTKVRISDTALLRARKLWEEDEAISELGDLPDPKFANTLQSMELTEVSKSQTKEREKSSHSNKGAIAPSPHNFLGFCTGQGKHVEISKESLTRSRNIFEDIDISKDEKTNGARVRLLQPEYKSKDFSDGREEDLEVIGVHVVGNTSSVLNMEEKSAGEGTSHNFNQNFDSHRGFVTGRGKCLKVKEETLERVSKMFMDENSITEYEKNMEHNKNNLRSLVQLKMEGENTSNKGKLKEHEEEHIEETLDFLDKKQHCADNDEKERTPSPILGSQKSTSRLAVLDRGVPICNGKRKFSKLRLSELDPDRQIARPSNKRLSLRNSRTTNGIPKKSNSKLGKRGHSQSDQIFPEMHQSPAAESESQPTFLAPSPHPLPPESQTKAQDSLQTQKKITALPDTQEICAITEAFLEDDLREGKDSLESFNRKRLREGLGSDEPSGKKFKDGVPQMSCNQMEDTEAYAADEVVESGREMARLKQGKVARYKEKRHVTPIQGVLHRFRSDKKHSRIKMQSLGSLKVNRNVSCKVASINANNARMYRFPVKDQRCETVTCEDGCTLVPSTDGFIGVKEIEQGFLAAPGVHPGLLPPSWVTNHYRWIVWKLAALERRLLHCNVLTPENVVARLKYRYDREIDRAERPILRKIMEHDDVPQKTMILCVANVKKTPETTHGDGVADTRPRSPYLASETILELTDGWYSIDALTDTALSRFVLEEKVKIGTKLLVHGAEMAKHSPPCHPLQASTSVCLRLHANMTRRAKWWSRLGLVLQCGPLPTMIRGIQGDGGLVGRLTVLLARVYPPLYFEKTGGKSVFRSERAHDRLLRENLQEKERNVHQILAEVEREFDSQAVSQKQSRKTSSSALRGEEIRNLTSGKDIAQVMEEALDPSSLEGLLSTHQIELARSWRLREAEERKRLINLEVQRRLAKKQRLYEAVTILKIRIVDTEGGSAVVTIWRPSEETRQALTEGTVFSVHYLCANGHKYGHLQLTATRQTRWERLTNPSLSQFQDVSREVTPLCLTSSGELAPPWREVDVVGIVLRVSGLEAGSQLVHLVDHQVNILALKFWGGIKECGMEDVVQEGALLCVSNGSWRGHTGGRFGCVHITELTAVTTQPRRPHLEEQAAHIKKSVENIKTLLCEGAMKLDGQNNERASPERGTSPSGEQSRVGREKVQESVVPENAQGDSEKEHKNSTPNTGLGRLQQRSREIRSKFKVLGTYGTPSALRSLKSPASRGTHKPFRMPFRQPLDSAKNE